MLTLYHADTAVCAAKVRVTLAEKALEWRSEMLDLGKGEQFRPDYVAINPNAVVPTLRDGDIVLRESTVINEYIDEQYPHTPLRPGDAAGRARMRLWTKREDSIHDAINTMTIALVFCPDLMGKPPEEREKRYRNMPDPARREKWRTMLEQGLDSPHVSEALRRFARLYRDMDAALDKGPWLLGKDFSLADGGLISFFYRLELMLMRDTWAQKYLRVADWFERCKQRPSFESAIGRYIPSDKIDSFERTCAPNRDAVLTLFRSLDAELM